MPEKNSSSENISETTETESMHNDEKETTELQSKIDELEEKLLRALAEAQNIQKRAEKEKTDIAKYSISGFAKDVLQIRDNLQLALNNSIENSGAIFDGIKMTMSEMDKILERNGITIIKSLDERFNPNFHQAMIEIESDDKEPGIIVQVMQEGFMIHDRLLRPALVGVSKKAKKE